MNINRKKALNLFWEATCMIFFGLLFIAVLVIADMYGRGVL